MKQLSFYPKDRHFTQYEAFIDFCLSAEDNVVKFSYGAFGEQWNWTRQDVARFIKKLLAEKLIELGEGKQAMAATLTSVCLAKFSILASEIKKQKKKISAVDSQLHRDMVETYIKWHEAEFSFKPMIDGSDGRGVKAAIKFLKQNTKPGNKVMDSWRAILNNYELWGDFHKKLTRLRQISSNIQGIIYSIQHGNSKAKSSGKDLKSEIERQVSN